MGGVNADRIFAKTNPISRAAAWLSKAEDGSSILL